MTKRHRRSTRSTAASGRTSGAARRAPSTTANTAPASTASAARASSRTSASSCAPSRSSRATTATSPRSSSRTSTTRRSAARATPSENLIGLLERRLDAVVYRVKFVPTVFAARQFVNHGHVQVNGKPRQHPELPLQGGRRDRGQGQLEADRAGARGDPARRARRAGLYRRRPQQDDGAPSCASRASPTCPIRCRWSRTSWSSSTRADRQSSSTCSGPPSGGPFRRRIR